MRRRPVKAPEIIAKINVTHIIDVALVLVIILLVTAPLMSTTNLPVNLPAAHTREAEDARNVCVTIATDGQLAVDDTQVPASGLRAQLTSVLAKPGNHDVLVVVRADRGTPFRAVRRALDDARAAGATHLAIATRQQPSEGAR